MMKIQGQCAPALGDLGRGGGGHGGGRGGGGWHGGGRTSVARVFVGGGGWGWGGGWGYPYWYGYGYPYGGYYYQQPVCASPCKPLNIGGYGCYTTDGTLATCVPSVAAVVPGVRPPGGYAL